MKLLITPQSALQPDSFEAEIVERKGLGHPDTVCDALAEEFSLQLSRFYLDKFKLILHHNVDKVLLWGGISQPVFGGGTVTAPIEIFLAGRAVMEHQGIHIPVEKLAEESCRHVIKKHIPGIDYTRQIKLHTLVRPGSVDLEELFLRNKPGHIPLANDTSCGVGFAPFSKLERVVYEVECYLNSSAVRQSYPAIGTDIKVMGVRKQNHIDLTIGCAFIDRYLRDMDDYLDNKAALEQLAKSCAAEYTENEVSVEVNTADNPDLDSIFMTVTGTSAEAGDDGEAGRGNRANGLITPYRPMTMESVAGKNPVTHVGKLYNVISSLIAEQIINEVAGIENVECYLVSQIGKPVDQPQIIDIRIAGAIPKHSSTEIKQIVASHLASMTKLWKELIEKKTRGQVAFFTT